jgi:coatomer protein complex subunit gamma
MATGSSSDLANQGAQWLQGMKDAAMQMTKGEKKDEDESYSPFQSLQKAAVLQECRCFNDREIVSRKCIQILTKILWLLAQGAPPRGVEAVLRVRR